MPDTMLQAESSPALISASCGVMERYRSPQIGQLVLARAKASKAIKAIIKDKRADIPNKSGGPGYQYAYADLATVLDAVEDAISEQGLAIFQTTQDRGRDGTYLITTLAHESDQWMAAEIRLKSADQGPQVYGSEMTYLRRYAVLAALALAPEADDDGKAAQDRADQAHHKPPQRVEQPRRTDAAERPLQAIQQASSESVGPAYMPIINGNIQKWGSDAWDELVERPHRWRQEWLQLHTKEVARLQASEAKFTASFIEMINSPDDGDRA